MFRASEERFLYELALSFPGQVLLVVSHANFTMIAQQDF
jgi:hypothetical protein